MIESNIQAEGVIAARVYLNKLQAKKEKIALAYVTVGGILLGSLMAAFG